jgi:hypothetical protein
MLARRGRWLSRLAARPSFAGRGLAERMRTTAFALLGVTTAMALGLVALISQQGWHYLPVGPIPSYQSAQGRLDNAIAVAPAAIHLGIASRHGLARGASVANGTVGAGSDGSRLSGPHRVVPQPATPDSPSGQAGGGGVPTPAGETVPQAAIPQQPSVPPPAAVPASPAPAAPTATPTTPSSGPAPPAAAGNPGKGHAYGRQKEATVPKPKPPHPAPIVTVPAAEPVAPPPEAEPTVPATGPGAGHGHAYGHDK